MSNKAKVGAIVMIFLIKNIFVFTTTSFSYFLLKIMCGKTASWLKCETEIWPINNSWKIYSILVIKYLPIYSIYDN